MKAEGATIHRRNDIVADFDRHIAEATRIGKHEEAIALIKEREYWKAAQGEVGRIPVGRGNAGEVVFEIIQPSAHPEGEVLVEAGTGKSKKIPARAIKSGPTLLMVSIGGKLVNTWAVATTTAEIIKATGRSMEEGSLDPLKREAVRGAFGWGASAAAGYYASPLIAGGPPGVLLYAGIVILAGFVGDEIGGKVADEIIGPDKPGEKRPPLDRFESFIYDDTPKIIGMLKGLQGARLP